MTTPLRTTRRRFPLQRRDRAIPPRRTAPARTITIPQLRAGEYDIGQVATLFGKEPQTTMRFVGHRAVEHEVWGLIERTFPGAKMTLHMELGENFYTITVPSRPARISPKLEAFFGLRGKLAQKTT